MSALPAVPVANIEAMADFATVFISYSRKDMTFVDRLDTDLQARGVKTLVDRAAIEVGEAWLPRLHDLIARAETVVFVLSPDSIRSKVCAEEVEFGKRLGKRFIPVVARRVDTPNVPETLSDLNYVFLDDEASYGDQVERLVQAIRTDLTWMRLHADLGRIAEEWGRAGRPRGLLLGGTRLTVAETWIAGRPANAPLPTDDTRELIIRSRRSATRTRTTISAALAFGLILSLVLAALAYQQRARAQNQTEVAVDRERDAQKQRDAALRTQSLFLADRAREGRESGDTGLAMLLALEALPDEGHKIVRPYVPQAEFQLDLALSGSRERALLIGHRADVYAVAFSPNGRSAVTSSKDGTVRFWAVPSGRPERLPIKVAMQHANSVAFGPNGATIVTSSADGLVRVWNVETGDPIGEPIRVEGSAYSAAFSPDGTRIVTAAGGTGRGGIAQIWDARTGHGLGPRLEESRGRIFSAMFSPDGKTIVTTSEDEYAQLWDAATGEASGEPFSTDDGWVIRAAFSPDGKLVATGAANGRVRLFDARTGEPTGSTIRGHDRFVYSVAFSPDGKSLLTASVDGTARIWTVATGQEASAPLRGHAGTVYSATFSPDGRLIATASADGTARLWRREPESPQGEALIGHGSEVVSAVFSPDATKILTASTDGTARIWDAAGRHESLPLEGHTGPVRAARFSPDGRFVATASTDGTARIWDSKTGRQIGSSFEGDGGDVVDVGFSPDGLRIVTASRDGRGRVWVIADSASPPVIFQGSNEPLTRASFSLDGRVVVTASDDGKARSWDLASGTPAWAAVHHESSIQSVAFSPDHRWAATTDRKFVKIWSIRTGEVRRTFATSEGFTTNAVFSPDGRQVLTAMSNGLLRRWDAESGDEIRAPLKGQGWTYTAVYSPDAALLLTASNDETARLWRSLPTTGSLVEHVKSVAVRCLTLDERTRAFLPPQPPDWCVERQRWPYHTTAWASWLAETRAGGRPEFPN